MRVNPELKSGDRVIVIDVQPGLGYSVPPGMTGTVVRSYMLFGVKSYVVKWDNGSDVHIFNDLDFWDFEKKFKNKLKKNISEMTTSSSGGKYKVPLVLAPQIWQNNQMGAFSIPASKYLSGDLSYDSYDNKMERPKKIIDSEENAAKTKVKRAKKMFGQNDGDGNPINGWSPMGSKEPGTPDYIKKIADLPLKHDKPVIKNYNKQKNLIKRKRMVESESEKFKKLIENIDVFKFFKMSFFHKYLITLRDSGITNMWGASPYLYMGKERINHEFKYENIPNEESFDELLDMADESRDEMIRGTLKFLESKDKEIDINNVERYIQKFAQKILQTFILTF